MNRNFLTASTVVLGLTLLLAGCGAMVMGGAAATGTYFYVNGKAQGTFSVDVQSAFDAAQATCNELQIPIVSQRKTETEAGIKGRLSGDDVTISMVLVGADLTQISVRVGLMGNEPASRRILGAISGRL